MAQPRKDATGARRCAKHRKLKRQRGICAIHGCHVYSGDAMRCLKHRRENQAYNRSYRARKQAAGLCTAFACTSHAGAWLCPVHQEIAREYQRRHRARRKAQLAA